MLGTQLKENHLLFIVSFVFTQDYSREYVGSTVSLRNCNSLKTELKKQTFFFTCFFSSHFVHTQHILKVTVFCGRLRLVLHLCSVCKLFESCSNFLLAQRLAVPVMVSWNPFLPSLSKKPNSVPPVSSKCVFCTLINFHHIRRTVEDWQQHKLYQVAMNERRYIQSKKKQSKKNQNP